MYFLIPLTLLLSGSVILRFLFVLGVMNLPAIAAGIFLGGLVMRRYKLSVVSGAQFSFATSFAAFLLLLLQFSTKCDNIPVAGLTVSYSGSVMKHEDMIMTTALENHLQVSEICFALQDTEYFIQQQNARLRLQQKLLMFTRGVGPSVLRQRHHLHLSMYGRLPQLLWTWQEHSRTTDSDTRSVFN